MKFWIILLFLPSIIFSQSYNAGKHKLKRIDQQPLSYEEMEQLVEVPLSCIEKEYPNKLNQVLSDSSDLKTPRELHPIFYGCFDWHSACHGYWLMVKAMNTFPKSKLEKRIAKILNENITADKVLQELAYFEKKHNTSFERTYGWAWLLKLHAELSKSRLNKKHKWTEKLQPLTQYISDAYQAFLPKLVYPIRVGEHTNTAFGLALAYEYATDLKDENLASLIEKRAKEFYFNDKSCPIHYEPSGFDFISPCLQEAHLMSLILPRDEFTSWVSNFLPELLQADFNLDPGKVVDRTDGKLVHLDGLNFSRAWCFYTVAKRLGKNEQNILEVANQHIDASKDFVIGADYMGSHWLASFLVYALFSK